LRGGTNRGGDGRNHAALHCARGDGRACEPDHAPAHARRE
jgi:hypothetical protein